MSILLKLFRQLPDIIYIIGCLLWKDEKSGASLSVAISPKHQLKVQESEEDANSKNLLLGI